MSAANMLRMDSDHQYWWGDDPVPGVTDLLKDLGIIDTTYFSEEHAARGKRRHKMLEEHDGGSLAGIHEEDEHILVGWKEFRRDHEYTVLAQELPLYDPKLHVAGTLDKYGTMLGRPWIIDIKCSGNAYPWHHLQTAIYRLLYARVMETSPPSGGVVYLREAKKQQYRFVPNESTTILDTAFSVIETYHYKHRNFEWIDDMHQSKVDWLDDLAKQLEEA